MKSLTETAVPQTPQTQTMEKAIEEALMVTNFFGLSPDGVQPPPKHLPSDPLLLEYLQTAEKHLEVPVGIDELGVLTTARGKRN